MTNQEYIMTLYAMFFLLIAFGLKLTVLYFLIYLFTPKD